MSNAARRGSAMVLVFLSSLGLLAALPGPPAAAAIYRWDTGELITEEDAGPEAGLYEMDLSHADLAGAWVPYAEFYYSDLTRAHLMGANLARVDFSGTTLTGADLGGANLTNTYADSADLTDADLRGANLTDAYFNNTLTNADLSGAVVIGTSLDGATGFTSAQLRSTASYQSGDLSGIGLGGNDLSAWDLAEMILTDANLDAATLTGTDLTGAVINGADFSYTTNRGFTPGQLYSTASFQSAELSGIHLRNNDLGGWNLAGKDLADADLSGATLTDTDFGGAIVTGASFNGTTALGFTAAQLYSTASYSSGELAGIGLAYNNLTGWDLAGKDLADANLERARLTATDLSGANLVGANLRNATFFGTDLTFTDLRSATDFYARTAATEAAILPDGRIAGLTLDADERLTLRDYNREPALPVTVRFAMDLDPDAALRMLFEDNLWGSTISFEPGVNVSLDGSLELLFAEDVRPTDLIGTTFDLFDWDGAVVSGAFDDSIVTHWQAVWDTSRLYTTGEVTLLSAVPEPSTVLLLLTGLLGLAVGAYRRCRGRRCDA